MTVVGGGETAMAFNQMGLADELGIFQQEEVLVYLSWLEKRCLL